MPEQIDNMSQSQEEHVLSLYFEAEHEILAEEYSDIEDSDEQDESSELEESIGGKGNVEPVGTPRPLVDYETKVPGSSTIIAMISQRRVDRLTPEQAWRTDTCLPCGRDVRSSPSQPDLALFTLPCRHVWCRECLARAFLFAKNNNTFDRLRCCTEEDIALEYFERIAEDREHPPPEWDIQDCTGAVVAGRTDDAQQQQQQHQSLPGLRDWNPVNVIEYVEKDQDVFISKGDIESYRASLEEFHTLPKDRVYCYRPSCGNLIPKANRSKGVATCPRCNKDTCMRCRKSPKSHTGGEKKPGKCTAGKARMEMVKNDRKLLVLARRKKWKRCPRCGMFVDKVRGGCTSVVCVCGRFFFYG